jgi:hypothetical protein
MAFASGNVATIVVDGNDISQYVSNVSVSYERDTQDLPRLGGNAVARLVGPYAVSISGEGWYDPAVDTILDALITAANPTGFTVTVTGQPTGGTTRTGTFLLASYEPEFPADDPGQFSFELVLSSGEFT